RRVEPVFERLAELSLEWRQLHQAGWPLDRRSPEPIPGREDPGRDVEQPGAKRALMLVVSGDLAKLADQMCPTQLALLERQGPVRRVPVRSDEAGPVGAEQRLDDGSTPGRVEAKQGQRLGHHRPEPAPGVSVPP